MTRARAKVELSDALMTFVMVVALVLLAPVIWKATSMAARNADPFSALLLKLVMPLFIVGVLASVGVSARRRL